MKRLIGKTIIGLAAIASGTALADVGGYNLGTAFLVTDNTVTGRAFRIDAAIDTSTDEDYFKFVLAQTTMVTVLTVSDSPLDTYGYILDYQGTTVASNNNGAKNPANPNDFAITTTLAGGTYYIKVRPNSTQTGSYRLQIVGDDYYWAQGQGSVNLGATNKSMCYLTGLAGKFEGGGERVQVYKSGSNWYLGGQSSQSGVQGWARCVDSSGRTTTEYSWGQDTSPVYMAYGGDLIQNGVFIPEYSNCWLQGMAGKFRGSGERVYITPTVDSYFELYGTSGQRDVRGWASCSPTPYPATPQAFFQGQGGSGQVMLQTMKPLFGQGYNKDSICYLNDVRGHFAGGGEQVRIINDGVNWTLRVQSYQNGVGAGAVCTNYM